MEIDDLFEARLAEYDAALASGQAGAADSTLDDSGLQEELRTAQACLEELEAIWPRRASQAADAAPAAALRQLGRFLIIRELGRGGGGIVFLARDPRLSRDVALKIPRPESLFTPALRRRFLRETEAAAQLNHPHIVPVFEAGEADGICYLISAYCEGQNLAAWLRGRAVPARQAALIALALADGVAHMHSRGILHRDIKPTNVLLESRPTTNSELSFVPRLTDFGLAKIDAAGLGTSGLRPDARPETAGRAEPRKRPDDSAANGTETPPPDPLPEAVGDHTFTGTIIGTPAYMAPEQAEGRLERIGPTTDVYALGVLLYELLAGEPPFRGATDVATLQQVVTNEPRPLRRRGSTRSLTRLGAPVPGDLEAVCLKCLEKSPARRYATARELAADLGNFLEGKPTVARPVRAARRAVKWARRQPMAAALLATMAVGLGAVIVAAGWYVSHKQKHEAEVGHFRGKLTEAEEREREQQQRSAVHAYADRFEWALELHRQRRLLRAVEYLTELLPAPEADDLRGFEWHYLRGQCHPYHAAWRAHDDAVCNLAVTSDGKTLASNSATDISLWDFASGRVKTVLKGPGDRQRFLAFSPDDRSLASGWIRLRQGQDPEGHLTLWDVAGAKARTTVSVGDAHRVHGAFTPDGKSVVVVTNSAFGFWDALTGARRIHHAPSRHLIGLAISNDQKTVFTGSVHGDVTSWDVATGVNLKNLTVHDSASGPVALTADGGTLASGSSDRTVRLWDVAGAREIAVLRHRGRTTEVAWSTDGRTLAVVDNLQDKHFFGQLVLWDMPACLPVTGFDKVEVGEVGELLFVPGTSLLALPCVDGAIRVLDTARAPAVKELLGHAPDETWSLAFSPDGATLASGGDDHHVRLWDAASGKLKSVLEGHEALVSSVAFSKDGKTLASAGYDGAVKLWDVATRKARTTLWAKEAEETNLRCLALAPNGAVVAAGTRSGELGQVRLWDTATGQELPPLDTGKSKVRGVAFSPNGAILAAGNEAGMIRLWETATWQPRTSFQGGVPVSCMAFSSDGRTLAWGTKNGELRLWDMAVSADKAVVLSGHVGEIFSVAYSAEGRTIATAGEDKTVRLWQAGTGRQLMVLEGHAARVNAVAFTPDSRTLASAGHDGMIRIWPSAPAPRKPVPRIAPLPLARTALPDATLNVLVEKVVVQDDGKILVAGATRLPPRPGSFLALTRYHADGALDRSFGTAGTAVVTHETIATQEASRVLVMPDGKAVLIGTHYHGGKYDSPFDAVMTLLSPQGTLDTAFGDKGVVLTDYQGKRNMASAVALTPDGKLVVAGSTTPHNMGVLARYLPDGRLDPDFGDAGLAKLDADGVGATVFYDLAVQPDGKLLLSGTLRPKAFVIRMTDRGSPLDPAFGTQGKIEILPPRDMRVYDCRMQRLPDGKVVTATRCSDAKPGPSELPTLIALERYDADGKLDPTYGERGRFEKPFPGLHALTAIAITPDGGVLVAGETGHRSGQVTLARFTPDGRPDLSFGKGGATYFDLKHPGGIRSLAMQPDGKIIAAGEVYENGVSTIVLYRFHPDGRPDTRGNIAKAAAADGK